ncbi:MAG: hypothetical protein COB15_06520 [Flavobacteriales bacterium]|nr:MAG: hypothetical protein COB15_06520 [Flavobacteriales bacterium]
MDSLWSVWEDNAESDSIRLNSLKQFSLGYYYTGALDSAFHFIQIHNDYAKSKGLKSQQGVGLRIQAATFSGKGNHQEVIVHLNKALKLYTEINDQEAISNILSEIGITYRDLGNYRLAIKYLTESLTIAEKLDKKELCFQSLMNIAIVYSELGDLEKSLNYFERSLKEGGLEENSYYYLQTLRNIGLALNSLEKFDQALKTLNQCLKRIEESGDIRQHPGVLNGLGIVHLQIGDTVLAKKYYKQGWKICEEIDDQIGLANSLVELAQIYFIQNDIDSADYCSQKALGLAKTVNSLPLMVKASELRYKIHKHNREPWLALEMHDLIVASKDSLRVDEARQEVIHQEYKYEYDKKKIADEKQQEIDRLENQQERTVTIFVFILILVLLGSIFYHKQRRLIGDKEFLLSEIEFLKENAYSNVLATDKESTVLELNKTAIEKQINAKLNQTDWGILNVIYQNPTISNKEIAEEVSLSIDGVSSSLKKMYSHFNFTSAKRSQKKLELVVAAARYSKSSV